MRVAFAALFLFVRQNGVKICCIGIIGFKYLYFWRFSEKAYIDKMNFKGYNSVKANKIC